MGTLIKTKTGVGRFNEDSFDIDEDTTVVMNKVVGVSFVLKDKGVLNLTILIPRHNITFVEVEGDVREDE